MDEFEDKLVKIVAARQQSAQEVRDRIEPEKKRILTEQRAKSEPCLNFYNRFLAPILNTVNEKITVGGGRVVVSARGVDPEPHQRRDEQYIRDFSFFCATLVWRQEGSEHTLGFDVDDRDGGSFMITVFAGRVSGNISHDHQTLKQFTIQEEGVDQIKKCVLELLSNPEVTKVDSYSGGHSEKVY